MESGGEGAVCSVECGDVGGAVEVSGSNPIAYCRSSDVSAAVQDSTIVIDSTTYTVIDVENDETGMTLLRLRT